VTARGLGWHVRGGDSAAPADFKDGWLSPARRGDQGDALVLVAPGESFIVTISASSRGEVVANVVGYDRPARRVVLVDA